MTPDEVVARIESYGYEAVYYDEDGGLTDGRALSESFLPAFEWDGLPPNVAGFYPSGGEA